MFCQVPSLLGAVDTLHLGDVRVFASEVRAEPQSVNLFMQTLLAGIVVGVRDKGVRVPYIEKAADELFFPWPLV